MKLSRRSRYDVIGSQELFMVPILREAIAAQIDVVFNKLSSPIKVLDVGAGECPLRDKIIKYGALYSSLDIGQNSSQTINFCCHIDRPLPDEVRDDGPYDFILCTEVMEHVANWSRAFDNFSKLLVPGGYLLITTPFFYMLHEEPNDYWRPTDHALKYFARQSGLLIDHTLRLGDGLDVLGTLLGSTHVCRKKKSVIAFIPTVITFILHRLLLRMVCLKGVREYTSVQSRFYLSNVILLHKP